MKKIIALILTAIMVFSFAACNGGKDEDPNLIKIGDYQAVYKGSEIVKDSDGNDTLVATYDYTNNSKVAQNFSRTQLREFCKIQSTAVTITEAELPLKESKNCR